MVQSRRLPPAWPGRQGPAAGRNRGNWRPAGRSGRGRREPAAGRPGLRTREWRAPFLARPAAHPGRARPRPRGSGLPGHPGRLHLAHLTHPGGPRHAPRGPGPPRVPAASGSAPWARPPRPPSGPCFRAPGRARGPHRDPGRRLGPGRRVAAPRAPRAAGRRRRPGRVPARPPGPARDVRAPPRLPGRPVRPGARGPGPRRAGAEGGRRRGPPGLALPAAQVRRPGPGSRPGRDAGAPAAADLAPHPFLGMAPGRASRECGPAPSSARPRWRPASRRS